MTNINHVAAVLLLKGFYLGDCVMAIIPDAMRCWSGAREPSHFTLNPETGQVSWIRFPTQPLSQWSEEVVKAAKSFNAGKPGYAAIDEDTILSEFWQHNRRTWQNIMFFLHLVQDRAFDRRLRSIVDTSRRYDDIYVYNGVELSGDAFRGKAESRWSEGLVNELDQQVFLELSRRVFRERGIVLNQEWFDTEFSEAVNRECAPEFAERIIPFLKVPEKVNQLISSKSWDEHDYPFPNHQICQWVDWMLQDVQDALYWLKV